MLQKYLTYSDNVSWPGTTTYLKGVLPERHSVKFADLKFKVKGIWLSSLFSKDRQLVLSVVQENWSTVRLLSNYFQLQRHCCASHLCTEECPTPGRKMCSLPGRKLIFRRSHASFLLREEALTSTLLVMTLWPSKWLVCKFILGWPHDFLYYQFLLLYYLPRNQHLSPLPCVIRRTPVS